MNALWGVLATGYSLVHNPWRKSPMCQPLSAQPRYRGGLPWVLTKESLFVSLSWSVQSRLYVKQKGLWGNDPPWEVDHQQLTHTSGTLPFYLCALLPFCPFSFFPFAFQPVCSFSQAPLPFHWPLWVIPCWLNCTTTNLNSNLSWC